MDKNLVVIKAIIEADYQRHIKRFDVSFETGDILFLGDSVMAYAPLKKMNLSHLINQGIPGDTTSGVLNRLSYVYKAKPKVVFLHIGSNDLVLTSFSKNDIIENIQKIILELKNSGIIVYLLSITPILPNHQKTNQTFVKKRSNEEIDGLNEELKTLRGVYEYIDVNSALKDDQNQLHEQFTTDGVHLNQRGYDIFFRTIKQHLDIQVI
jgi:lysophospholipase L1-like esterase